MYDSRSEWLDRKELEETEGRRRRSRRSHVTSITYSLRGHQVWNQGGLILRKHVRCRYIPAIFPVRGVHTSTATVTKPDTCLAGLCAVECETGRRNIMGHLAAAPNTIFPFHTDNSTGYPSPNLLLPR